MVWQVFNSRQRAKRLTAAMFSIALVALLAGPGLALGDGKADPSFGVKGIAAFDPDPLSLESPSDMTVDAKGRIVLAGTTTNGPGGNQAWFARLKRNGELDPSFGTGGVTLFSSPALQYISSVTTDSEGRIVAAGDWYMPPNRDMWLVRLQKDGTTDPGFGIGGGAGYDSGHSFDLGYSAVIGKDGLIYFAGSTGDGDNDTATVLRYTPDGNLDPTWGVAGVASLNIGGTSSRATAICLDRRGRVVLGGQRSYADDSSDLLGARLTRKGHLDPTFNKHGFRVLRFMRGQQAYVTDLAIDGKGRVLLAGSGDIAPDGVPDGLLARLKSNGKLDPDFGQGGKLVRSIYGTRVYLAKVRIDRAGRIVLAGGARRPDGTNKALLLRLRSDGGWDRSFGKKGQLQVSFGKPEGSGTALAIDRKGRYLLGGGVFDNGLAYVERILAKYPRRR